MPWNEDKKQLVIKAYEAMSPTAETSMEVVKEIAEDFEESPNGVRLILAKAGVYIKVSSTSKVKSGGSSRTSKADSQKSLSDAIIAAGQETDMDVISKLTGKAAVYLTKIINAIKD